MPKVGMTTICASIRAKGHSGERCTNRTLIGSEWCGKHNKTQIRFVASSSLPSAGAGAGAGPDVIEHSGPVVVRSPPRSDITKEAAASIIHRAWARWIARRAGPLLRFRAESNNPYDFFSGDPIGEIAIGDFVSFVDAGKGYVMDIKSATSLLEHAEKSGEAATNPFNRAAIPALFVRRVVRHRTKKTAAAWAPLVPMGEAQTISLAATDLFRLIEDLGYYTDPGWFMDLGRAELQRFYIELADIWNHRATLTLQDRMRIVPPTGRVLSVPVSTALIMQQKALRPLLLKTCKSLVSAAAARSDKQLGVMYVLGALSLVSPGAGTAYPWLTEMFSPGVSRIHNGHLQVLHASVMSY